jgi:2-(3-amino-3-carboxypropyl)histidine synthase
MKVLYIKSKQKNLNYNLNKKQIAKLPKNIFLAYSIQYYDLAKLIKKQLEKNKIKIHRFQQVLGCSIIKSKHPILLIGTGRFHAINLYLQAPEVYLFENNKITKVPKSEIEKVKIKRKTALMKFLKEDDIGIVVSTKPGQENLKKAVELKNKLKNKGKQGFIFLSNNIDTAQFENFDINAWVNTACAGLNLDNQNIININEIPNKI